MHFSFNLLKVKSLYMFRAFLGHLQEALQKRHLVYCVRVMSVGCTRIEAEASILAQPTDITRTQYTKCRLCSISWWWASNARNMQRPLILNKLNEKCITLVSLYWCTMMHGHYTDILWCIVTILIYCDARSLYRYTVMHGQQNIKLVKKYFFFPNSLKAVEILVRNCDYDHYWVMRTVHCPLRK
jgi:hypothetical protein